MPENHDGPPDSSNPAGLCPRCEKQSSFENVHSIPLTFDGGEVLGRGEPNIPTFNQQATVLICRNCHQGVVVLEEQWIGEHRQSSERAGVKSLGKGFTGGRW